MDKRLLWKKINMFGLVKLNILLIIAIFTQIRLSQSLDYGLLYMESSCGTTISFTESFQMDSSTGITYDPLLNCSVTISAPGGNYIVAHITRFELENAWTGSCTDYIEVYDGSDTSATKLNTDLVCGTGSSIPSNYTSTDQQLTIQFVTDSSGSYTGFNLLFVAATDAPCSGSQFTCNTTSICIPTAMDCDGYDQCGDNSDEQNCDAKASSDGINVLMVVVITITALLVLSGVIAVVAYRFYVRNKWKKFVNSKMDDDDEIIAPGPSYPITHKYYTGLRGHPNYFSNVSPSQGDINQSDGIEKEGPASPHMDDNAESSVST